MGKNALLRFTGTADIEAEILLTGSKSECNRALILQALAPQQVQVENVSDAADSVTLTQLLNNINSGTELQHLDVGPAGTAMRFLTAYLSTQTGSFMLTGSARMQQRPIALLVEALQHLGANIRYEKEPGYPPLYIRGPLKQQNNHIVIPGDISSQYISALLLIAPALPQGLKLEISGGLTSRPYVEMTLDMLKESGITHQWKDAIIEIPAQAFKSCSLTIEPDWSAASYWYSIAALAGTAHIKLKHLKKQSLQGDSAIAGLSEIFGLQTQWDTDGLNIVKARDSVNQQVSPKPLNLKSCPDLAQTIIVMAAAAGLDLSFTGLETLKIKETDRIAALQNELLKIGVKLWEEQEVYTLDCSAMHFPAQVFFNTYEDHRMAMAFAPLAMRIAEVEIEDFMVVEKSYPNFWKDLQVLGFQLNPIH